MYGFRLVDVVRDWTPAEAVSLLVGLTTTRSRYAARLQGYSDGKSWQDTDYMALDSRNILESVRGLILSFGNKKPDFKPWKVFPGKAAADRKRVEKKLASYRRMYGRKG